MAQKARKPPYYQAFTPRPAHRSELTGLVSRPSYYDQRDTDQAQEYGRDWSTSRLPSWWACYCANRYNRTIHRNSRELLVCHSYRDCVYWWQGISATVNYCALKAYYWLLGYRRIYHLLRDWLYENFDFHGVLASLYSTYKGWTRSAVEATNARWPLVASLPSK